MSWIFLAVGAQLINAIVALIDKRIVSDESLVPRPFVYAFYTCLLSGSWIIVYALSIFPVAHIDGLSIPSIFNIERPTLEVVALSFLAAYTFFIALTSMFSAFRKADASDVVPVVGAVSALGAFGLGYFFLDAQLSNNFMFGIVLLATGTFLVSRLRFSLSVAMNTFHAGIFFALHYVVIKGLFTTTSFDDGFFWSRIAFMLFALTLLLVPVYYEKIAEQTKNTTKKAGAIVFLTKVLAGISSILILKATDLGDVAVVQALGGLQFVFILIIGMMFGTVCDEGGCRQRDIVQKAIFVAIISLGVLILFV